MNSICKHPLPTLYVSLLIRSNCGRSKTVVSNVRARAHARVCNSFHCNFRLQLFAIKRDVSSKNRGALEPYLPSVDLPKYARSYLSDSVYTQIENFSSPLFPPLDSSTATLVHFEQSGLPLRFHLSRGFHSEPLNSSWL